MDSKWRTKYASKRGIRHQVQNLLCQDRVCYKEEDELQIIALADGTSNNDLCIVGVEKVLNVICDKIIDQYETIETKMQLGQEEEVKCFLTQKIQNEIEKLAIRYQVSERMFSSTMLVVCVNRKKNSFFSLHLGDGIIIYRKNGNYQILSEPENGSLKNQTYLTTSSSAKEHLRICFQHLEDVTEFLLVSDGTYEVPLDETEELYKELSLLEIVRKNLQPILNKTGDFGNRVDDQSMIMIYNA